MIEDPIIEEVRRYRKQHAARYSNDLQRIVAALKAKEHNSKRELLEFGSKILLKQTGTG